MENTHFLKENWMSTQDLLTRKDFYKKDIPDDEEYFVSLPVSKCEGYSDEYTLEIDPRTDYDGLISSEYKRLCETLQNYK